LFAFTDDYSVFDYGKMPDRIRGKGSALAMMTAYCFEQLENPARWEQLSRSSSWDKLGGKKTKGLLVKTPLGRQLMSNGLRTHYKGLIDQKGRSVTTDKLDTPSNLLLVEAVPVLSPKQTLMGDQVVWNYNEFHQKAGGYLIPLENVFRFGIPKGSSLLERVQQDPSYARQLGLSTSPKEGSWLPFPILEFFTKLEPSDRYLALETAVNFSGLSNTEFTELMQETLLIAVFLYDLFYEKGLELWDGKLEYIRTRKGLVLADSITPDELRLTCKGMQLSKELLRQYYKNQDSAFYQAITRAKKVSQGPKRSLRTVVQRRFGIRPRKLEHEFLETIEIIYRSLAQRITSLDIFGKTLELQELLPILAQWKLGNV
jgi:phosphoribosylaminoimidazole-succinocarboxamide synthase